ncbi:DDB1- and CUL4-associated factor 8 isoform X2 [Halyomorpha halys]|uniref:DDB1- and CUL4-associated factor 8 isoform X2 n=1 Tax=Halyomorpha halys TaxID=286706 RepID=UPI0006D4E881|nr:DDB1- and CUL4-associated factor 8-like isoform X2 [Halyomorpha halys]
MNNNYKSNDSGERTPNGLLSVINNEDGNQENNDREGNNLEEVARMDEDVRSVEETSNNRDSHSSSEDEIDWGTNPINPDWLEEGSECSSSAGEGNYDGSRPAGPKSPNVIWIPKPKHKWFVVKEIAKREIGDFRHPASFTQRFYGSLHAVQRLELMYKLEKHEGCVNAINFNSSGTRLISGSDDKLIAVWNWTVGKCLTTFNSGHSSNVFQCKYLPLTGDGHIVTCSRDGQVRLALQTSNGGYESSQTLAHHSRACHKISIIKQEPHVVLSAGADAQVFCIDVREKKPNRLMYVKEDSSRISLYSINVNPLEPNEFCISGEDLYIRLYDRRFISRNGVPKVKYSPAHLQEKSVYVTCAVFSYNGAEVIGSYNDDDIYMFDTKQPSGTNYVHRYEGHRNSETVKGVNFFGPKSEFVVSGSDCGNIYIWDKNTEAIVQWMRGDEDGVINCLEPHPKIPVLATSGLDSDIKIWVPSCENEPSLAGLAKTVKINRKKRYCRAIGSRDSLNDTLVRWWRQMRYIQRHQNLREGAPIFIEIGTIGRSFARPNEDDDSSISSSSSSSSSSSCSD